MKRLFIILCILFFASPCLANQIIIGKKKAAPSCSVDTNEVGDKEDYTSCGGTCHLNVTSGAVYCMAYTADCTGTLSYAYARHYDTSTDAGKLCVYTKTDTAPNANDTLVGCGTITTSAVENAQSAAEVGGSVTATAAYWVCIAGSDNTFDIIRSDQAGGATVYYDTTGFYDTPPNNLGTPLAFLTTANRAFSMYVTIK